MNDKSKRYIYRDVSWLSFNERVLQEASDPSVPVIERIKFLGIFSNNRDEFFRVRIATLKRMSTIGKNARTMLGGKPTAILNTVQKIIRKQGEKFDEVFIELLKELERHRIFIISENELDDAQGMIVREYFHREVRPTLVPVMIDQLRELPNLKDHAAYFAVEMAKEGERHGKRHALIEIPTNVLSRFFVLPPKNGDNYIILLDDVIRYCLSDIFSIFNFTTFNAYMIKLTRDAELDLDNDVRIGYLEKISKSVKQRKIGVPVRFIYDETMPKDFLALLIRKLHLRERDTQIPGGRYHNFKHFMKFPKVNTPKLLYEPLPPIPNPLIDTAKGLMRSMRDRDIILHYPYQSFHYMIDLLREAAIDPNVKSIKMTLYRVAKNSNVVNALINAVKNGKSVTVVVELQARFDEEANIYWTQRLEEEGAKVITGVPGLKVHTKLCLITRRENGKTVRYAHLGTGNFNEDTAGLFCDDSFFTVDKRLTSEVHDVFSFYENNQNMFDYHHLLVSPFTMRKRMCEMIDTEIANAKMGKEAYLFFKMNNLSDQGMIEKLYEASNAGVRIRLIVRSVFSLIPGKKGMSENIEAISIVDRFLEHARVFIFCNGGDEKYYISSADLMTRNLDYRSEVACPIYDRDIQRELREMLDLQWQDNTKARVLKGRQTNQYRKTAGEEQRRAQYDIYKYLREKANRRGVQILPRTGSAY